MRRPLLLPTATAFLMALAGCQASPTVSPTARPTTANSCPELAARIVDAVQDYVDSFADVPSSGVGGSVSARQADFGAATRTLRERGAALRCTPDDLAGLIRAELKRLTGGTPVQDAVADAFRADPLGTTDPTDPAPTDTVVSSAQQLVTAISTAGSGSTIRLAAGTYAFRTPLVLLRPITLTGAGNGADGGAQTLITSSAGGATLIAATSGNLTLTDLAITHTGANPASVLIVAGGGYRFERLRVAGGVAAKGAGGYGIVLRPSSGPLTPTGDTRLLTDLTVTGNDGGGIVVAGQEQPTISRARVAGDSGCGLCWVEQAGGTVSDSSVTGTKVGLRIDNDAAPTLTRVTVERSEVGAALTGVGAPRIEASTFSGGAIGIQVTGSGTPLLTGNDLAGSREIAVRLSGISRTTLTDNRISGRTKVGIATVATASSTITGGEITSTGDVGLIWGEKATGTASGVIVRRAKLGVQLAGEAVVDLTDLVADDSSAAALLADGTSKGRISRLACGKGAGAFVVLAGKTTVQLIDSPSCTKRRP